MDNMPHGTNRIRTVSKPALSLRTCCFHGKKQVVRCRAGAYHNRIKTPSVEAVELAD